MGGASKEGNYASHASMLRGNPLLFVLLMLLVPVFGLGLIGLAFWALRCRATHLEVSNGTVTCRRGLLRPVEVTFSLSSVRTVKVRQGPVERLTGAGTVEVTTAGDRHALTLSAMPDIAALKRILKRN